MMKKALIVWGGWDGHSPEVCARLFAEVLGDRGFEVEVTDDLEVFADKERLSAMDLIVPMWTMGALTTEQEEGLLDAVAAGTGIGGFHGGMGDSFRANARYQFMVGGQFVEHPGGIKQFDVTMVAKADPIVSGLCDFKITTEQYYMHVDPSNEVLAATTFGETNEAPWVKGTIMPVVWKRMWGKGRVFYCSAGHLAGDFDVPELKEIVRRGLLWAAR